MPAAIDRRTLLALGGGAWLLGQPMRAQAQVHRRHHLFGSPVDLIAPAATASAPLDEVLAGLQAIHRRWHAWKPGDVTRLNQALRDGRAAAASPALIALIRQAAVLERQSCGFFNPALGGLVGRWGFHADEMHAGEGPRDAALTAWRRAAPSMAQLEIHGLQVRSTNPAVQFDFGAYAKGVAIDAGLDRLRQAGVERALLNLGGNLAAMDGDRGTGWTIGIRSPVGEGLVATLQTRGREAVVTSGSYERFRLVDGDRATHILDPFTARPAPELVSVTVVHPSAGVADAAATALLVAGPARWQRVAERLGVTQVLLIDRHGQAAATAPLAARLRLAGMGWPQRLRIV